MLITTRLITMATMATRGQARRERRAFLTAAASSADLALATLAAVSFSAAFFSAFTYACAAAGWTRAGMRDTRWGRGVREQRTSALLALAAS